MKSRILGGLLAIVLALSGAVLTFVYAQAADDRAMSGLEPTQVLVVTEDIPEATPVEDLSQFVAVESRPASAVPSGALSTLDTSEGLVTATALLPGEYVMAGRLVNPASLEIPGSVPVPDGLQELTFSLDPQRVAGGRVIAGDTVGLYTTFEATEEDPAVTQQVFHKVLVTGIQRAEVAEGAEPVDEQALPTGTLLVTVAVTDVNAARIIYSAEFGRIWLTKEPATAPESEPTQIQREDVYP